MKFVWFSILFSVFHPAWSQLSLSLSGNEERIPVGRYAQYWEDPTNEATLSQVLSDSVQQQFKSSTKDILAFGLSPSSYWIKLPLAFENQALNQNWLLEFTLASYAEISLFEWENSQWHEIKTGAYYPFSQRPVSYRFFAFPLSKSEDGQNTYYVRIKTERAYTIPIVIYRSDSFISKVVREEWLYGAFMGILVFIGGYNFLLFLSLRERSYLYCATYVLLSAIILGIYNGYLFQFLLSNVSAKPALLQSIVTLAQRIFIILFTIHFLGLRQKHWQYYVLLVLLILLSLTMILTPFIGLAIITHLQLLLSLLTLGFTTYTSISFWLAGTKPARFIFVGYLLYTLGSLYNNLLFYQLVTPNFFSIHGPEIGIFLEAICLTLALGDKYRSERQAKTQELQATVASLAKHNEDLEQFSFVVSHNLRSPVARILGLVNVFELDPKTDIGQHLKRSANTLDDVIRELTEIVSLRKNVTRTREDIHLPTLLDNELKLLQDNIKEAGGQLITSYGFAQAIGWGVYLKSIVNNLVSNAIKYRHPDRPLIITITTWRENNEVALNVRDNGLGIRPQDLSKIFGLYQRFYDHVEGKGLGLYLVKTQVEAMNGRIVVESKLGEGSSFTIYLPFEG